MFETLFLYAAIIGGGFMLLQFIMLMLGFADDGGDLDLGGDGDLGGGMDLDVDGDVGDLGDADHHHSHAAGWFYEMISLRTLSAAATFFGLVGKTATSNGFSDSLALLCATAAGFAAMYGMYWIFKQIYKLETAGNENIRNAVGKVARVYIPIPGNDEGAGKVQFRMQDRLVEYQAVTEEDEKLSTGENVVVVGVVNSDTVCVARTEELAEA